MQTDSLFYRLFQHCPQLALTMLQLPYKPESYRFVSEEIKQTGFRIDGLFKPLDSRPDLPLIFAEVQFQPDEDFYGRFFAEIMLYLYRQKPPPRWLALVIYPNRQTERPPGPAYQSHLELPEVRRVYLEDYLQKTEPVYDLLRLIACSAPATVTLARELAQNRDKLDREAIEFIETVLVYKLPKLSREEIRTMLG